MAIRAGILTLSFSLSINAASHAAENWDQFRGPGEQGQAEASRLPTEWGEKKNVAWKTPVEGKAWSSPVVWGDRIWVTKANPKGTELSVVCLNKSNGKVLYDKLLWKVEDPQFCHAFNSYASPTPVLEDGLVYLTFGSPYTACLKASDGEVVWKRSDFVCDHFRGAGSSPILYKGLLILNFDGADHQFVVAMDKKTGKTIWKTPRSVDYRDLDANGKPKRDGDMRKAYGTPLILKAAGGHDLLVSAGAMALYGYDPMTGKELWRVETIGTHSSSCRPVTGHGLIYATMGFSKGLLIAVRPGGKGLVSGSHVAWKYNKAAPKKPSILLHGDLLFMVDDGGGAACLDAKSGKEIWKQRIGGNFSASPILADGRIYLFDEDGKGTVIAADRAFKVIATNELEAGCMGSPAVSGDLLIVRTKKALYGIRNR
ncbi:MAG: quinonprotein alcohol dehydrogenase [Roseibacillus sp.]|nr:quinonprotein alcohol dehydrogenase [Roseibacillus sp.]